jgi:tRNA dimethylallyltransferase
MFYLVGPTASGKSALALKLAEVVCGEIINADAFQLYRELPITSAQPSAADLAAVPHHLYGALSVTETVDAQKYHDLVQPVVREVLSRGKWPIIVGGSGLYIKALTHGLAPLPPTDLALRERLLAETTAEERRGRLLELDPEAELNVPLANDRYVTRALEICLLTGEPQSRLRRQWEGRAEPQFTGVLFHQPRERLLERIATRTQAMLRGGMIEEIAALTQTSIGTNAQKAIGVPQVRDYIAGKASLLATEEAIVIATRRYAKRQMTWFRREKGFQTICPEGDSSDTVLVQQTLALFPCLLQPPPSVPSLSI